jgi:hypothetical protein
MWLGILPERTVFKTINGKLMLLKDPKEWHFHKYNITHYLILPK